VDVLYFDVYTSAEYPADNATAEGIRMGWLEAWLSQFNLCASGYDVIQRREFEFMELNAGRYDLRYEVQCKVVAPQEVPETD